MKIFGFKKIVLFLALMVTCGVVHVYHEITCINKSKKRTKLIVEHSDKYQDVYNKLVAYNLSPNVLFAKIAMKLLSYNGKHIIPGEYIIDRKHSLITVLNKICSGEVVVHNIIIWRGQSLFDIKEMIAERSDLLGELTCDVKEGELFAGKYEFKYPMSKNKLVYLIKEKSRKTLKKLWANRSTECIAKTPQECISLASIVAREAMQEEDISLVASVFINRLNKKIRLQSDPTVIYALTNGTFRGKSRLSLKDTWVKTSYNTYRNNGIPPHPISSPSIRDIKAILFPVKSHFMYFISQIGDIKLYFSKTFEEHCNLKKKFKK